ncbi:MAG: carbohydrate kinase family protein [Gemmataceae bacterium]|nr:carbohydrate kinase family protein [Gemmataceae bacterium]
MIDVLCAGIIVADHVCTPIAHLPAAGELVMADGMLLTVGGCAANAAVDLAKMQVRVGIVGRVGDDVFGRVVSDILREANVDTSCLKPSPGVDTSQTLIVNVQGQDRRFIHTFGANRDFRAADIPLRLLDQVKVLYLGGYLVMPGVTQDELVPVFAEARKRGVKTVLDIVVPAKGEYLSRFDRLLPYVDVFLPNDHEAELITGEKDPLKQAAVFQRLGAGTTIITMGGGGSILVQQDLRLRTGAYSVPLVDASGGGDAFDAGYICGLLESKSPEDCLRVASALGASCVRAIGTTPGVFTRAECEAFLRANELKIEQI